MQKLPSIAAATLIAFALTTPALAAPSVAVSVRGSNSASCGAVASPCRTLRFAYTLVDAGGTISVLDSGDYGDIDIRKALNVVYAGQGVALVQPGGGGNAILINAGASDAVRLRGLTIDGGGTGVHGVAVISGGRVDVTDCMIHNFTGGGFAVGAGNVNFSIVNTTIGDNGLFGVLVNAPSGAIRGTADKLRLFGNRTGGMQILAAQGATNEVVVTNSVAMGHRDGVGEGFRVVGAGAALTLEDTTSLDNKVGAQTFSGTARLSDSILVGNDFAVAKSGGAVETFSNNIFRNSNDALGALTPVPLH